MRLDQQVTIIWAGTNGLLDDVPVDRLRAWEDGFHSFMENSHPEIGQAVMSERQLSDATIEALRAAVTEYKQTLPS
jgi:F-type H+-transporting ATPase subunit alpha